MHWFTGILLFGVAMALVISGLGVLGARRWAGATRAIHARLDAQRRATGPVRYDPREIDHLPAPVQRYFRAVLTPEQPLVTAVTLSHTGQFNMSSTGEQWKPFTSRQRVVVQRPGFLWDARIAMLPGLPVRVHDSYAGGQGLLRAAVLGLFRVADLQGDGELARGELMRFLAEAAWYPTALLPSQGVQWTAVDWDSANATLTDGALSLTLLFRFDGEGMVRSVFAQARGRMVGRQIDMAPWEGTWSGHRRVDGMTVPFAGEVAWLLPEGRKTYWRGTVTALGYEWSA